MERADFAKHCVRLGGNAGPHNCLHGDRIVKVEAAFVMVAELVPSERGKLVEAAMLEALQEGQAEGITDPLELRRRILAARDRTIGD